MMDSEKVNEYIRSLVSEKEEVFLRLEEYANEKHVPIIHKEMKPFLEFIIKSNHVRSILEIGTAIGYSALVMSRAMDKKGFITSIERREDYHLLAKENIGSYTTDTEFELLLGDALEVLSTIDKKYDMIFIDASKGHYKEFLDSCLKHLKIGGVIVSDNVLYQGMIADDSLVIRRKKTIVKRMRDYLEFISNDKNLVTTIIPISDGVSLTLKVGEHE